MSKKENDFGAYWSDQKQQIKKDQKTPTAGDTLEAALDRANKIAEEARAFRNRLELFAAGQPQTVACKKHPHRILTLNLDASSRESQKKKEATGDEYFVLIYESCPECGLDAKSERESSWLQKIGVPENLITASFKTFRIERDEDRENMTGAKAFVEKAKGFLIMTGNFGDGKSMLAVAVLREFASGLYITHNDLLLELRRGYGNRNQKQDIIERAQAARCFVIDDFGLSMGGADELPMLQSILDHRYGEKLPTVITTNLPINQVYDVLGPRLADRLKQATYRILRFTGPSSRSTERGNYLA